MDKTGERPMDIAAIRKELPVLEQCVYLNAGTAGIAARPVQRKLLEEVALFEEQGEVLYRAMNERMNAARARMASFLGASPDELTFNRNATDGVNIVVWGLDWKEGDEVIISDQEHPAMNNPWHYRQACGGPKVKVFHVDGDPDATLHNVRSLITPRTRMITSSHVTSDTGTRIPAREFCSLAREHDALSLLDGAQAVGQFPVDVGDIGCDFYTTNGHKWLHGPKGTGMLFVRQDRQDLLRPSHVGSGSFERPTDLQDPHPVPSARRYEYGTRSYGTYSALPAAVDYLGGLGWEAVERRMRTLSSYLKARLAEVPGLTLLTPLEWERSSAMASFTVEGVACQEMHDYLWATAKIRSSAKSRLRLGIVWEALRISTAYFNTEEEVDLLVETLHKMVAAKD